MTPLRLLGPFGWPKQDDSLPALPALCGVYIEAILSLDERTYFARGVGYTERPYRARHLEHRRNYESGWYNLVDLDLARRTGERRVIWQGWEWTPEKRAQFEGRRAEHCDLVNRQLSCTAAFVIDGLHTRREFQRMEAALLNHYYAQPVNLLDKGQQMSLRRSDEPVMTATFAPSTTLRDFPETLAF